LNDKFESTVVLDDSNVELRIRVSDSMPGKNFPVWNPVFLHTAGDNYRHLWRVVYLGVIRVTVMVSVSGSETYLVIIIQSYRFDFFTNLGRNKVNK